MQGAGVHKSKTISLGLGLMAWRVLKNMTKRASQVRHSTEGDRRCYREREAATFGISVWTCGQMTWRLNTVE